ncbi:MAG: SDR family oxidoreductase [Planctomycetota bacterium]|jgi:NAD(P)-dependent dehydrogenase (short-subunit alcohol dehydrogenase family)|nr:SDR family oxidoreductase [Planctomycetota bacterium]
MHSTPAPKRVLITGADGGIGQALAAGFHAQGWDLVVHGREATPALPALAERYQATALHGDLAVPGQATQLMEQCLSSGRLDALINNAAWDPGAVAFDDQDPSFTQAIFAVNLAAPLELIRCARAALEASGGCVVNISSIQAQHSVAGHAAYAAAKGGLEALTKALAVDLGPAGIRINAVAPGFVAIDRTISGRDPSELERRAGRIPLRCLAKPEEIAGPVLFLCSSAASHVTGTILPIDGGTRCYLPSHLPSEQATALADGIANEDQHPCRS